MQRKKLLLIMTVSILFSCTLERKGHVKKHLFLEKPLPKDILKIYIEKMSLKEIENGVDSFEIRKWYPFYYTDSFPVALERIYYQKQILNAECYLFSDKMGGLVTTKDELPGLQVEKYTINNLPLWLLDSIRTTYSLAVIDTFDLNIIKKKNEAGFSTGTARNVFFEQSTGTDYYGVFFSNPDFYAGLHASIDKYAAFDKFTHDILNQTDTAFKKWFDEKGQKIISVR